MTYHMEKEFLTTLENILEMGQYSLEIFDGENKIASYFSENEQIIMNLEEFQNQISEENYELYYTILNKYFYC